MSKHTPGPWHINAVLHSVYAADNLLVCDMPLQRGRVFEEVRDERYANTRLIAAAPELAAALADIVNNPPGERRANWLELARTLLVKAGVE